MTIRLMTVDDSAYQHQVIAAYLKDSNYEIVTTAMDGKEAVKLYEEHKPDIVLLDVVMPEQDGLVTLVKIRSSNPEATVIMVSSVGNEDTLQKALRAGAVGFIQKPVSQESLLDNLDRHSQSL